MCKMMNRISNMNDSLLQTKQKLSNLSVCCTDQTTFMRHKSEGLVGCLLKSWTLFPLIKLIHWLNKLGTGSRCECRHESRAGWHPSPWSGIFSCMLAGSPQSRAELAERPPYTSLTQGHMSTCTNCFIKFFQQGTVVCLEVKLSA